jgi:Helix-turn-helix of DDE superfamily endonuclease
MCVNYKRLSKRPLIFRKLSGVTLSEFQVICDRIAPLWASQVEAVRRSPAGRKSVFRYLEDRVLALLIYYRTYVTHEFIGYLFGVHNTNVCRLFKRLEPLFARKIAIRKGPKLNGR